MPDFVYSPFYQGAVVVTVVFTRSQPADIMKTLPRLGARLCACFFASTMSIFAVYFVVLCLCLPSLTETFGQGIPSTGGTIEKFHKSSGGSSGGNSRGGNLGSSAGQVSSHPHTHRNFAGEITPDPGYLWASSDDDDDDYSVIYAPHAHRNSDGKITPDPGYLWASSDDDDDDYSVIYAPHAHRNSDGKITPDTGYTWANDNDDDYSVIRTPGMSQERYPHRTPSTEMLTLSARVRALDKQIAEMEKQLRGLGFKEAVPDFTWLAGQSQEARQTMVSHLISRVRHYAVNTSEEAMKEHFLKYIGTMKEDEVKKLADFFQNKGADEPLFQEWLRSFSPNASRANLVAGAQLAIDLVKGGEGSFQVNDEMAEKTVQGKQEAFLTLVSTVVDYPGMNELQLVASGFYDAIEAGVITCIFNKETNDLTTATVTQLADQKKIMLRMKNLVDERKAARKKLSKL